MAAVEGMEMPRSPEPSGPTNENLDVRVQVSLATCEHKGEVRGPLLMPIGTWGARKGNVGSCWRTLGVHSMRLVDACVNPQCLAAF